MRFDRRANLIPCDRSPGYTLIEALVTVALLTMVAAILLGAPIVRVVLSAPHRSADEGSAVIPVYLQDSQRSGLYADSQLRPD